VDKIKLAYVIGIAIGDGNLSNPNGRAVRLRVTCDIKYQNIIKNVMDAIQSVLPNNKVSLVYRKKNCLDVSCFSNKLEELLGWRAKGGSKYNQNISIPKWIFVSKKYVKSCLRGLIETDGSIYFDRKYKMVNFVTTIPSISNDVIKMITSLGFKPNIQIFKSSNRKPKYTIRISRDVDNFIKLLNINKN
jgi:DNA-binding transcriptional regulator WhiA